MHLHTYVYINTQEKFWKDTLLLARDVGLEVGEGRGTFHFYSLFTFLPEHIYSVIYLPVVKKQLNKKRKFFKGVL